MVECVWCHVWQMSRAEVTIQSSRDAVAQESSDAVTRNLSRVYNITLEAYESMVKRDNETSSNVYKLAPSSLHPPILHVPDVHRRKVTRFECRTTSEVSPPYHFVSERPLVWPKKCGHLCA